MNWGFPGLIKGPQSNEPPWYGPVCPVVWEGELAGLAASPSIPIENNNVVLGDHGRQYSL